MRDEHKFDWKLFSAVCGICLGIMILMVLFNCCTPKEGPPGPQGPKGDSDTVLVEIHRADTLYYFYYDTLMIINKDTLIIRDTLYHHQIDTIFVIELSDDEIMVSWQPSQYADGYKVYWGDMSRWIPQPRPHPSRPNIVLRGGPYRQLYANVKDVGSTTSCRIPSGDWYVAVTAYNTVKESVYSKEATSF